MVLNRSDFGKFWKSLQTPWNHSYTPAKGFLTPWGTFCVDFRWNRKGPKSTIFEQKAWAIAHGFEQVGFWQVLEIAPNSLKRLLHPCKWIFNNCGDHLCWFPVNSQGSEIDRFWAKSLGYSPWFWRGRILVCSGNHSKLLETTPTPLQMNF